jgi:hypothetical protein
VGAAPQAYGAGPDAAAAPPAAPSLSRAEEAAALERQVAGGAGAGVALRCMRLENELVQARVRDGVTRAALDEWREKALALQRRARAAAPEMAE